MKTYLSAFFTVIFVVLISVSCINNVVSTENDGALPRDLTPAEKKVLEADQTFSYKLFHSVSSHDQSENIFISPLSVSMALGMTLNGADGATYEQMKNTLSYQGLSQDEINSAYQSLINLLQNADPQVTMQIANSVWNREGFEVHDEFIQTLETYFNAQANELDFSSPQAPEVINGWVSDHTNGLIQKIIEGNIPPEMVMYLINAIYFKGDWTYQFDNENTQKASFTLPDGRTEEVDMMNQKNNFNIYRSEQVNMVDLPYGDSLYTMSILMPGDPEMALESFIAEQVNFQNVRSWTDSLTLQKIDLNLPKFSLEYKIPLNDVLKSMGMQDAFNPSEADFSGINPNYQLFISEVMHKTFVDVNEEGTEAAAVTSVGIELTSINSFQVNRPFIFLIREQNTGTVLFMGKVNNPA